MVSLINGILGGALLLAGRKIFWLFVGAAGFITGLELTTRYFHGSDLAAILVGLVVGILFAVLAIFLQTIAIGIAGFLAGGYVLLTVGTMLGIDRASLTTIIFVIGGIIGVLLVSYLFDWALITLSSLAGAALVVQAFHLQRVADGLMFLILLLIGVGVQGSVLRNEERPSSNRPSN